MKNLVILFTLLFSSILFSQNYYEVKINLSDNSSKLGYAILPNSNKKIIKFKSSLENKVEKIKNNSINSITYIIDNQSYTFCRSRTRKFYRGFGKDHVKISKKKKGWFYLIHNNSKMNYYMSGQKYEIDKNGDLISVSKGQGGFVGFGYYLKRPEEEYVTYITSKTYGAFMIGFEKIFRYSASTYFSDNEELVNRINSEEFNSIELFEIYTIYISEKK